MHVNVVNQCHGINAALDDLRDKQFSIMSDIVLIANATSFSQASYFDFDLMLVRGSYLWIKCGKSYKSERSS